MDPPRSPDSSDRQLPRRALSPSPTDRNVPAPSMQGHSRPQHTLPPIRQLHPGLSHSQPISGNVGAAYTQHQGLSYSYASGSSLGAHPMPEDSDLEVDQQGPPKKKRRRQALSCTECKRRKIKCDRAQPCGPCARRGESNKCQWHIIEPMEKYVTRAEYDELRARFDELESVVARIAPGFAPAASSSSHLSTSAMMPMVPGPPAEPVQGTAITPYHQGPGASATPAHHSRITTSPNSPIRGEALPSYTRQPRSIASHSPSLSYRVPTGHGSASHSGPNAPSTGEPARASASPLLAPNRTPPSAPSAPVSRRHSLSLAAITTPYTPDPRPPSQPKNCHAQTPPSPGPRLRPSSMFLGSALVESPRLPHLSRVVDRQWTQA